MNLFVLHLLVQVLTVVLQLLLFLLQVLQLFLHLLPHAPVLPNLSFKLEGRNKRRRDTSQGTCLLIKVENNSWERQEPFVWLFNIDTAAAT